MRAAARGFDGFMACGVIYFTPLYATRDTAWRASPSLDAALWELAVLVEQTFAAAV